MCTVTLITRSEGYLLGMNRDEQRARVKEVPPAVHRYSGTLVAHPSEPHGGTWIAVNHTGITFALINWYSVRKRAPSPAASRGRVIVKLSRATSLNEAHERLAGLHLDRTNPFRLIGVSLAEKRIVEWQWNLEAICVSEHAWQGGQWISSGFDEPGAQRSRTKAYRKQLSQDDFGETKWLRRLHSSHSPRCGAYSTCMHRPDAVTVSYTEIEIANGLAEMRHLRNPPCQAMKRQSTLPGLELRLRDPRSAQAAGNWTGISIERAGEGR